MVKFSSNPPGPPVILGRENNKKINPEWKNCLRKAQRVVKVFKDPRFKDWGLI